MIETLSCDVPRRYHRSSFAAAPVVSSRSLPRPWRFRASAALVVRRSGPVDVIVELAPPPARASLPPWGELAFPATRSAGPDRVSLCRLASAVPEAEPRWRYRLVLDGIALRLPPAGSPRSPPCGWCASTQRVRYLGLARRRAHGPRASAGLAVVGDGGRVVKIGIIDDGIDQRICTSPPPDYVVPAGSRRETARSRPPR